jgi:hypothetical protein
VVVRHRRLPSSKGGGGDAENDDDDAPPSGRRGREDRSSGGGTLPVPKVISDLLLQTAFFGIDATARLSRPTLDLATNTILPQVVLPLFVEIFEHYVPARLQTWMKVGPTSFRNLWNLLCDTDAGRSLGDRIRRLGEDVADLAGSEAGRQCCIDATVAMIRLLESLRTPEVRALLDQCAVGTCRFMDAASSGGAKRLWFDVSDAAWALIEVGSDEAMVTSLAEGCAQICFALENERDALRRRRGEGGVDGGSSSSTSPPPGASKRRRERDRRQMGTYPPGRAVVNDDLGRDGFGEALRDGLNGPCVRGGEIPEENDRDQIYADMDNIPIEDDGPPRRVIVTTNSSSELGGGADLPFPNVIDEDEHDCDGAANTNDYRGDDGESEITTDMEDLRRGEDSVHHDDAFAQGGVSEMPIKDGGGGSTLKYEQDDGVDFGVFLPGRFQRPDWHPDDDGSASEKHDAFDESILQFYRRMNEVLVESRKHGKLNLQVSARGEKPSGSGNDKNSTPNDAQGAFSATPSISRVGRSRWRLIIIASLCGVSIMCTLWFVLGCYGFYVLVLGGGHVYRPLPSLNEMKVSPNIVIQIVASKSQCDANTDKKRSFSNQNNVAAITLDEWNAMKRGVDRAVAAEQ